MSYCRPPETRTCADCPRKFRVAGGDSKSIRCVRCRFNQHRNGWGTTRRKLYPNTKFSDDLMRSRYDGKVYGRAAEIAKALNWPDWRVKRRAAEMGLTHPWPSERRDWDDAEVKFLQEWTGKRYVGWIAKKLGRSITSCVLRIKRLGISRRVREGYTMRHLQLCFGTDHHVIERWVKEGRLRIERGIPCGGGRGEQRRWKVNETAIFEFIWNNPTAFRLDKVDQPWFMDLMRRSLQAAIVSARSKERVTDQMARVAPILPRPGPRPIHEARA